LSSINLADVTDVLSYIVTFTLNYTINFTLSFMHLNYEISLYNFKKPVSLASRIIRRCDKG
jgi:hypothetical protein